MSVDTNTTPVLTLTGIGLDTCRNLTGTDVVEIRNVLAEHGFEVTLADTLGIDFGGPDPYHHVDVRADEHANTCNRDEYMWG